MKFDYYKYHALGNDYIVIDPQKNDIELNERNIKLICHRNYGIGSDGILYGPIFDSRNDIHLRIFNPDGSEAEKSGNGIREFSKYLFEAKYVKNNTFWLKTLGGNVKVTILDDFAKKIKVNMGVPTFVSKDIPTLFEDRESINKILVVDGQKYVVSCVSIGNPHCVMLVNDLSEINIKDIGPKIENHVNFPNKINVQFMKILDRHNIQIEIWERGAGYTLASGTSSCAAASVAYKLNLVDNNINVHMPGGIININYDEQGSIDMTGDVTSVGYGFFSQELLEQKVKI